MPNTPLNVLYFNFSTYSIHNFFPETERERERERERRAISNQSMETEGSSFETSEVLATFLASTPLLSESWQLCNLANTKPNTGFLTEQIGDIGYVAFSSMEMIPESDICYGELGPLDRGNNQLFSPLHRQINEGEDPIKVHTGFLDLFFAIYSCPDFVTQMEELMKKSKSIVITGHSIRGTTASLSTLWLLSSLQSIHSSLSVLCITFGSPLLGNESLSRAILRERWDGNFCHVVAKYDIMPRLLFSPLSHFSPQLPFLLKYWQLSLTSPENKKLDLELHDEAKEEIYRFVLTDLQDILQGGERMATSTLFWPFGSYFFCSEEGAICIDNASSVIKMMYLMLTMGSPSCSIEDHLRYGDYAKTVSFQFLNQRSFMPGDLPESCYEAGIALALQSSGIASQEPVANQVKDCLKMAKRMGRTPNLNLANLAIKLSQITPYRAQIEWYKNCCDESDDRMGYYDSFKLRGTSKRDSQVNMNRMKLGIFWDHVIEMLENNHLPHDFHMRGKWVNASQFYMLLVEPLDIANYYRDGKSHYMQNGRERRYKIFDRWWRERRVTEKVNNNRSTLASLTQDTCFWAKVEEAKECLDRVRSERDRGKLDFLWMNINAFERYAAELVESKQVSKDVLAQNSSYVLWVEELKVLRSQLMQFPVQFPSIVDAEVVP
ncbi:hypothetical protein LWI29_022805 [Acer saccharum]|uniref:Lipase-like PAD4 n=1 Tax=Acer saccharum TaxID=4024 RepID=A0AA39TH20_ACESA|nr:hypothetical protein LWI29_022805 [Acer saccharum]